MLFASLLRTATCIVPGSGTPVVTPPNITTSSFQTVEENQAFSVTLQASQSNVSWAIVGGLDQSKFTLVGAVLGMTAKDYENPTDSDANNTYGVVVSCTTDTGGYAEKTIVVTVTDASEVGVDTTPPTITSANAFTVPENTPFTTTLTANETVTWTKVAGGDLNTFTLNGAVLGLPGRDYDIPGDANGDNIYRVRVRATDTAGNWSEQVIDVTITNVDDTVDPAQALIDAMDVAPSANDESAIRNAVDSLVTSGVWPLLDWFSFALADEQASTLNWKNPGTSTGQAATKSGTVNFVAYEGFTSDGSGYMDTGLIESAMTGFDQDDAYMSVSLHALGGTGGGVVGNTKARIVVNTNGTFTYRSNTAGDVTPVATGDNVGPFTYGWSRDGAAANRSYFKGTGETAATTASSAPNTSAMTFCAAGAASVATHTVKSVAFGAALTAQQHADLYTIRQTLAAALNQSTSANALAVGTEPLAVGSDELTTS